MVPRETWPATAGPQPNPARILAPAMTRGVPTQAGFAWVDFARAPCHFVGDEPRRMGYAYPLSKHGGDTHARIFNRR